MADVYIPDDILHNILARLPAKPLLRFRCVSKHWNRLISDPNFMKSRSGRKMLLVAPPLYVLDGSVLADNSAHSMGRLPYLFDIRNYKYVRIVGTFNGIVLLVVPRLKDVHIPGYYANKMIIYNPFTGVSKILPDPYSPFNDRCHLYGFCYGATLDNLMIVRFRDYGCFTNHNWKTCDVFNLKTSLWSTSEIPILDANFMTRPWGSEIGIFLNGFLYWIASNKIVALSVEEMVISHIPIPFPEYTDIVFGTMHGCLCMITEADNTCDFNVWIMKEHGVENPWSKVHSFRLPYEISCHPGFRIYNTMDDGRVLMVDCSNHLIIYDTLKHSYEMLNVPPKFIDYFDAFAIEYDESLVSLSNICGF